MQILDVSEEVVAALKLVAERHLPDSTFCWCLDRHYKIGIHEPYCVVARKALADWEAENAD